MTGLALFAANWQLLVVNGMAILLVPASLGCTAELIRHAIARATMARGYEFRCLVDDYRWIWKPGEPWPEGTQQSESLTRDSLSRGEATRRHAD